MPLVPVSKCFLQSRFGIHFPFSKKAGIHGNIREHAGTPGNRRFSASESSDFESEIHPNADLSADSAAIASSQRRKPWRRRTRRFLRAEKNFAPTRKNPQNPQNVFGFWAISDTLGCSLLLERWVSGGCHFRRCHHVTKFRLSKNREPRLVAP
jgi:hypothetical protein